MKTTIHTFVLIVSVSLLAACAGPRTGYPSQAPADRGVVYHDRAYCERCGTVESVERVRVADDGIGLGAVIGAVVGAAAGNQVGDGSGQKAATAAGAVGGAIAGHQIQKRNRDTQPAYRFVVELDDGRMATITQEDSYGISFGDRVRLVDEEIVPA